MNAWAIRHWREGLYIETVRPSRRLAIEAFKDQFGLTDKDWQNQRARGVHRAVKVIVLEESVAGLRATAQAVKS